MINKLDDFLKRNVEEILNNKKTVRLYKEKTLHKFEENGYLFYRLFDVIGSIIALVFLSPLLFLSSLLILIDSGFPILFKQKRMGKNGKLFNVYKFRTMKKEAEKILRSDPELYKKYIENGYKLHPKDDPRILKFGHFLRNSSIDEIPQFFNVIKGDMSVVGPRPIVPEEIERYGEHSEEFLSIKPGITGLWQVCGRSNINYPDRKYLDLIYISNKSLFLDINIIFKTFIVVFKKIGAH